MDPVKVILPLVLAFIMFSLGLGLKGEDFSRVLRFPRAFGIGLLNQILLLPLVALLLIKLFQPEAVMAFGIMILALSPGGVTTNVLTRLAKGNTALSISMTAVTSILAILTLPLLLAWSSKHFLGSEAPEVNVVMLCLKMALLTAIPVLLGMFVARKAPGFTGRLGPVLSKVGVVLFVVVVIAALAKYRVEVFSNLSSLGPILILLNVFLLVIGLLSAKLLGLGWNEASTISIESGVQNSTVAITVAGLVTAGEEILPPAAIPAAVYGVTMYLLTLPFVLWRARRASHK